MPSWWGEQEPSGIFYAIHWFRANVYAFFCVEANNLFIFPNIHKRDENRCYNSWSYCFDRNNLNKRKFVLKSGSRNPYKCIYKFLARQYHVFACVFCFNSFTFSANAFSLRSIRARIFSPSFVFSVSFADLPNVWVCVFDFGFSCVTHALSIHLPACQSNLKYEQRA